MRRTEGKSKNKIYRIKYIMQGEIEQTWALWISRLEGIVEGKRLCLPKEKRGIICCSFVVIESMSQ